MSVKDDEISPAHPIEVRVTESPLSTESPLTTESPVRETEIGVDDSPNPPGSPIQSTGARSKTFNALPIRPPMLKISAAPPTISLPMEEPGNTSSGATTAPVYVNERTRFFSFSTNGPNRGGVSANRRPPTYMRQTTVGGDASHREFPHAFARAISRTYTLTSNASSSIPTEEWRPIFDKLDESLDGRNDGQIQVQDFRRVLAEDPLWMETVPPHIQEHILSNADQNQDGVIDFEEFMDLVRGRHIGFGPKKRRAFRELLKNTVDFIVPYKYSYQNQYSCSPPPFFMLGISLIQTIIFVYNSAVMYQVTGYIGLNGPVPYCSHLIYNPDRREQVWRFFTYMFIHSGIFHATFNILVQLVLGIPLEMVHGWWRVMLVYVSGVLAGSLWTSIFRPTVFLSGASGGVYSLITAHLGTVIMNYREMVCPWCRILIVCVVALSDVVVYIYDQYVVGHSNPVSYPAHIAGAITGLLVGITCLKNLRWEKYERYIWAASFVIFATLMLVAIIWNIADPARFTGLAVPVGCISNQVL